MSSRISLCLLSICCLVLLTSCSGQKNHTCLQNCGGSGNASVTISLFDTPPTGVSILSFTLPISGISLTPLSGSLQAVTVAVPHAELTRLQTDSAVIADQAPVPAGSYSAINLTVGPTSSTNNIFINTSGSTITYGANSCLNGKVCALPVGASFTITAPLTLTLSANGSQWIGLDFDLNKAITTSGGISVDFTQAGVLTATTTPSANTPSGSVDLVEDHVGVVTVLSTSSITVQSAIANTSLTAVLNSTTEFDVAPLNYSQCSSPTGGVGTAPSCLKVGSTVSIDALLSAGGIFTAKEVDVLDTTAVDDVEGIILPTSTPGEVEMIIADKTPVTSGSTLAASTTTYGTPIFITAQNATTYSADAKTLFNQQSYFNSNFSGSGSLLGGQVVRVQVSNLSTDNSGNLTATAKNILLRWSRLSGTVNLVQGNVFTIGNLQPYIYALNTSLSATPQVNTSSTQTIFQGTTGVSGANFPNASVSIRALYFDSPPATYPFEAAKVRVH